MKDSLLEIARTLEKLAAEYKPPLEVLGEGINRIRLTENFGLWEFQCSCCGQVKIHPKLVEMLQALREKVGKPVIITSGYRCPEHNKAVGGVKSSYHTRGMAADIKVSGVSVSQIAQLAETIGFNGIGIYPSFVHVDIRDEKARWTG